jgi:hypothetical protein
MMFSQQQTRSISFIQTTAVFKTSNEIRDFLLNAWSSAHQLFLTRRGGERIWRFLILHGAKPKSIRFR